jgi:glutamate synthase (NADPH/NADH) small chain
MEADVVFKAIGQSMQDTIFSGSDIPEMTKGKIAVNNEFETSLEGVWSGGDCVGSGEDLTVQAVEDGKQAAHSIHQKIMQQ